MAHFGRSESIVGMKKMVMRTEYKYNLQSPPYLMNIVGISNTYLTKNISSWWKFNVHNFWFLTPYTNSKYTIRSSMKNNKINMRAIRKLFTHELGSHQDSPVDSHIVVYALLVTLAVHTVSTSLWPKHGYRTLMRFFGIAVLPSFSPEMTFT